MRSLQFIAHEPPASDGATLEPVLRRLTDIARRAGVSVRTLNRRFGEQTGSTPLRWLRRARLHRARCLLETTDLPVERIAFDVGFGSTATFRDRFQDVVGTSPRSYRTAFRGTDPR